MIVSKKVAVQMDNMIVENSLFTNQAEKDAFIADKQKVASAFWINLLGMIGMFSFSSNRGLMKTYFQDDKQLRLTTIGDENKDLSLLVKLYTDIGGMPVSTANNLTRLLVKMKQKGVNSKNFDEAEFKQMVGEMRLNVARPHPQVLKLVKAYIEGDISLQTTAKEMFFLVKTKKKEFLDLSGEYYTVAKQYVVAMKDVPRAGANVATDSKDDSTQDTLPVTTTKDAITGKEYQTTVRPEDYSVSAERDIEGKFIATKGIGGKYTKFAESPQFNEYMNAVQWGSLELSKLSRGANVPLISKRQAELILKDNPNAVNVTAPVPVVKTNSITSTAPAVQVSAPKKVDGGAWDAMSIAQRKFVLKELGYNQSVIAGFSLVSYANMSSVIMAEVDDWVERNGKEKLAQADIDAAEAEAKRIADQKAAEEAQRLAAEQAEKEKAEREAAEAEAKRLADEQAALEAIKAAEAEAKRLADIEAQQKAEREAAEALAAAEAAKAEAERLAAEAKKKANAVIGNKESLFMKILEDIKKMLPKEVSKYVKANKVDPVEFKTWVFDMLSDENSTIGNQYRREIFSNEESYKQWTTSVLPFVTRNTDTNTIGYLVSVLSLFPEVMNDSPNLPMFTFFDGLKAANMDEQFVGVMIQYAASDLLYTYKPDTFYPRYVIDEGARFKKVNSILVGFRNYKKWKSEFIYLGVYEAFNMRNTEQFQKMVILYASKYRYSSVAKNLADALGVLYETYDPVFDSFNLSDEFLSVHEKVGGLLLRQKSRLSTTTSTYFYRNLPFSDAENDFEGYLKCIEEPGTLFFNTYTIYHKKGEGIRYSDGVDEYNRQCDVDAARAFLHTMMVNKDEPRFYVSAFDNILSPWKLSNRDFSNPLWDYYLKNMTIEALSTNLSNSANDVIDALNERYPDVIASLINRVEIGALKNFDTDIEVIVKRQIELGVVTANVINSIDLDNEINKDMASAIMARPAVFDEIDDYDRKKAIINRNLKVFASSIGYTGSTRSTHTFLVNNGGLIDVTPENIDDIKNLIAICGRTPPRMHDLAVNVLNSDFVNTETKEYIVQRCLDRWISVDNMVSSKLSALVKETGNEEIGKLTLETANASLFDTMYDLMVKTLSEDSPEYQALVESKRRAAQRELLTPYIDNLMKSEIKMGFRVDSDRMGKILKMNNIDLIAFDKDRPLKDLKDVEIKVGELPITDGGQSERQLNAMSVALHKHSAGRHGDTALRIMKVFDVDMPGTDERIASKMAELKEEGTKIEEMEPVFHGTGPLAANMILRNGFRVMGAGAGIAFAGHAIGSGIYFSNKIDKSAQYVKSDNNDGYDRKHGVRGIMFEMYCLLGKHKRDFTEAGTGSRRDAAKRFRSPEWCVFDAGRQLRINKAFYVERVSTKIIEGMRGNLDESEIDAFEPLAKRLNEGYSNSKLKSFNELLKEDEEMNNIAKTKNSIQVNFIREVLTEEMISKFGENVVQDSDSSFTVYTDGADFVINIPLIEDFDEVMLDSLLKGDYTEAVKFFGDSEE